MSKRLRPTLSSAGYWSPAVYELDRTRSFHTGWVHPCHVDGIPAGTERAFDVAGGSVLLTGAADGELHAFADVCRHRGAQLRDAAISAAAKGSICCQLSV